MSLLCLGLSHRTAPLALRERLHFSPASLTAALSERERYGIRELAVLSTCNRAEFYALADDAEALLALIEATSGLHRNAWLPHGYLYTEMDAARHLLRVAAGLDSLILGEPQIVGQVIEAARLAQAQKSAGPVLVALFRAAVRAGKRARSETAISRNPASISSVAAHLAQRVVRDLSAAQVLIIGAGEMAELAVEALRSRGARRIAVLNRTRERSERLVRRWGGTALAFADLPPALASADIVISSTSAPHIIVTREKASAALAQRPTRPLVFIDIAVPRDIDPDVSRLPNVHRYEIDDLKTQLGGALAERQGEIPKVEAIVAQELNTFAEWQRHADALRLIAELRARAEAIRRAELEKTLRQLPHLSQSERQRIEVLAASLVNKLLHHPTLRLKSANGHIAAYADAVRHLFALDNPEQA